MRSAGFDVLVCAAADKRLDRKSILILAGIVWAMQHTGYATPSRAALAAFAGVSLKRVSNILYDLTQHGYIERINVPEEDRRVFTFGSQLDHERIESEISRYCAVLRGDKVPDIAGLYKQAGEVIGSEADEKFPEKVPGKDEKFPETAESSRKKFPENGNSSQQGGNSGCDSSQKNDPTLYGRDSSNTTTTVTYDKKGGDKVADAPKRGGGNGPFSDRTSVLVSDVAKWGNMPEENARQWIGTQRNYLGGRDDIIFEAARILASKLIAGDLIARPIAFLSQTINKLGREVGTPAGDGTPSKMSDAERAAKLRQIRNA